MLAKSGTIREIEHLFNADITDSLYVRVVRHSRDLVEEELTHTRDIKVRLEKNGFFFGFISGMNFEQYPWYCTRTVVSNVTQ